MQEGAPQEAVPAHTQQRAPGWVLAVMGAIIVVLCGAAAFLVLQTRTPAIPAKLLAAQKAIEFPLYYPNKLPPGYTLDTASISYTKDVAVYSFTYDKSKRVSFSIQAKHQGFSPDDFNPTSDFTSYIGRAYLVDLDDRSSAAVVGDTSWVLINAPDKVPSDTLRQLIDSLRPVPR
jgi:uncharacterized protein YdhG (YjbR/CyaY superfamily)